MGGRVEKGFRIWLSSFFTGVVHLWVLFGGGSFVCVGSCWGFRIGLVLVSVEICFVGVGWWFSGCSGFVRICWFSWIHFFMVRGGLFRFWRSCMMVSIGVRGSVWFFWIRFSIQSARWPLFSWFVCQFRRMISVL